MNCSRILKICGLLMVILYFFSPQFVNANTTNSLKLANNFDEISLGMQANVYVISDAILSLVDYTKKQILSTTKDILSFNKDALKEFKLQIAYIQNRAKIDIVEPFTLVASTYGDIGNKVSKVGASVLKENIQTASIIDSESLSDGFNLIWQGTYGKAVEFGADILEPLFIQKQVGNTASVENTDNTKPTSQTRTSTQTNTQTESRLQPQTQTSILGFSLTSILQRLANLESRVPTVTNNYTTQQVITPTYLENSINTLASSIGRTSSAAGTISTDALRTELLANTDLLNTNTFSSIITTSSSATSTFAGNASTTGHAIFGGNVTANAFYGDGSNLSGISAFSTSTTRGVFSSSATGLDYTDSTGVFSLTSGYNIPLTASTTEWTNKVSSQWTTSGSDVYYNGGNVGIGSTTPSAKLSVAGNGYFDGNVTATNITATGTVSVSGNISSVGGSGIFRTAAGMNTVIKGGAVNGYAFFTADTDCCNPPRGMGINFSTTAVIPRWDFDRITTGGAGSDSASLVSHIMTIDGGGSVGIGTTTPSAKLAITGSGTGTGNAFTIANSSNVEKFTVLDNGQVNFTGGTLTNGGILTLNDTASALYFNGGTVTGLVFNNNGTGRLTIKSEGNGYYLTGTSFSPYYFGADLGMASEGSNAAWRNLILQTTGQVQWSNGATSVDTGLTRLSAGVVKVTNGSSGDGSLIVGGNVGIGTTTPGAKLTVAGNAYIVGDVTATGTSTASKFSMAGAEFINSVNQGGTDGLRIAPVGSPFPIGLEISGLSNNVSVGSAYGWGDIFTLVGQNTIKLTTYNGSGNVYSDRPFGVGTSTPSAKLAITGTAGTGDIFAIASSTDARLFTVTSAGNVGIGTASPETALQLHTTNTDFTPINLLTFSNDLNFAGYNKSRFTSNGTQYLWSTNYNPATGGLDTGNTSYSIAMRAHNTNDDLSGFGISFLAGTTGASPSEAMRIGPTGNIAAVNSVSVGSGLTVVGNTGIGTTTPGAKLHALGTTEQLRLGYDASNYTSFTVGSASGLTISPSVDGTSAFNFTKADGTSVFNVDSTNRRVGVNNPTPVGVLDVYNSSAVPSINIYNPYASDVFAINKSGAGNIMTTTLGSAQNGGFILTLTDTSTYLYNSSTYGFKADISNNTDNPSNVGGYFRGANGRSSAGSNSNIAIGVDAYAQSGITGGTYGYAGRFTAQSANVVPILAKGASSQTADLFQVQDSSGTGLFNITSAGYVGIGTTTPGSKITVVGDMNLTGAFRVNGDAGSSGYVLQSTGSGVAWVATSSLGISGGSSQWTTSGSNIYYSTGSVGFGTSTPSGVIAVSGSNATELDALVLDNTATTANQLTSIKFLNSGYKSSAIKSILGSGGNDTGLQFQTSVSGTLANRLVINTSGGVDISGSLAVTGSITSAISVTTSSSGADYTAITLNNSGGSAYQMTGISFTNTGYAGSAIKSKLNVNGTATDLKFFTSTGGSLTEKMIIDGSGYVGIGTTTPDQELVVVGTIRSSDLLGGATNLTTDASGNIIRDASDERLKENIVSIESSGALDKVLALRGVTFDWKDKDRFGTQNEVGFIAQEVQGVVPEAVSAGGDYLSLSVRPIVAMMVEAIKELNKKINDIMSTITSFADKVQTKKLCVGDTCVTEDQLKTLLQNSTQPAQPTVINITALPGQEYSTTGGGNTNTDTNNDTSSDTNTDTGTSVDEESSASSTEATIEVVEQTENSDNIISSESTTDTNNPETSQNSTDSETSQQDNISTTLTITE